MIYLFKKKVESRKSKGIRGLIPYALCLFLSSCNSDDESTIPKPKGYFRIELPQKSYIKYTGECPFTFDYPSYAFLIDDKRPGAEPCWFDMVFPKFKSTLHFSYKPVNHNLGKYLEDSRTLAVKHEIKASGIDEQLIIKDSANVFGLIYNIEGNAASSIQFYLTDSTQHFLRGALYFNSSPNSDSIAPVLEFIKKDVYRMVNSFEWKPSKCSG